jgi:hypothetical protein
MHVNITRLVAAAALALAACGGERGAIPLTVDTIPSPTEGDAAEPFVARAPDGTIWMSWLERQADSSVSLLVSSRGTAGEWSSPREVVRRRDLFVNWADFPSVQPLADGRLLAHWLQRRGDGRVTYDVRLAESRDGAVTWSPDTMPHAAVAAEHGFVTILPLPDGGAGVVLLDGTAGAVAAQAAHGATAGAKAIADGHGLPMQLGYASWKDGGVTATRILDDRTCDCCQTTAAMTSRGPVVIYRDRSDEEMRDMALTRLVDGAWTTPVPLHEDGWKIDYCPVNGPAAGAIGDTVAVVWFTGAQDTSRVRVAFSTDAGATFGAPIRADDGLPTGRVDLEMLSGDAALVSWIERLGGDTAQVRMRVVRRDGSVEPAVVVSPSSGARSSGFPRMARDGDGVLIAYTMPGKPSRVRVARVRAGRP